MREDHVFNEMKCVIHIGNDNIAVLREFQDRRAALAAKQLQKCPVSLLKQLVFDSEELPKAS